MEVLIILVYLCSSLAYIIFLSDGYYWSVHGITRLRNNHFSIFLLFSMFMSKLFLALLFISLLNFYYLAYILNFYYLAYIHSPTRMLKLIKVHSKNHHQMWDLGHAYAWNKNQHQVPWWFYHSWPSNAGSRWTCRKTQSQQHTWDSENWHIWFFGFSWILLLTWASAYFLFKYAIVMISKMPIERRMTQNPL